MMTVPLPGPLWLIGCGNMAGAMLKRWLACGMDRTQVTVVRPSGVPVAEGVRVLTELPEDEVPAIVLLGVKPQKLDEVAPSLEPALEPGTIIVSILAGVEIASQRTRFPRTRTLVRAMPNLPVALGKGVVGLFGGGDADAVEAVEALMRPLGLVERFEDERLFNITTSLSGSGPAFLYRFVDAVAEAGEALGVPREQALRIAVAMAEGASALAASASVDPAELAERVASPRGTTRAGLDVLDEGEALKRLMRKTLAAAHRRSLEMAQEGRPPGA